MPARLLEALEQGAELLGAEGRARPQVGGPRARRAGLAQVLLEDVGRPAGGEQGQVLRQRGAFPLEARRRDVEDGPAADGDDRRVGAHHEAIAGQHDQRRLEPEAGVAGLAGRDLGAPHRQHAGHHLLGAGMEADAVARLDRARRVLQQLERAVQRERRPERSRGGAARRRARWRRARRPGGSPRCAGPAVARSTAWPCTCRPRTFDCTPRG